MSEHLPTEVEKSFRAAVDKCGLTGIWQRLRGAARLSYSITLRSRGLGGWLASFAGGKSHSVGESRFGGIPDLPQALTWPHRGGKLLTFVAQINLTEIPKPDDRLPDCGMLYFFLGVDEPAWDIDHDVFFWPGSANDLKAVQPPSNADFLNVEMNSFDPAAVEFLPTVSLPSFVADPTMDEFYDELARLRNFLENPKNASEHSCFLGHPDHLFGGRSACDAYLASHGRPELINTTHITAAAAQDSVEDCRTNNDPQGADHWSKIRDSLTWYHRAPAEHALEIANWQLLLDIDSHSRCRMNWWDAGRVQFLIDIRDLRALNFSKTYACINSH